MRLVSILFLLQLVRLITPDDVKWWRSAVIYQIYPRSFLDSNSDGDGDIKGIISKISYLKDIGVDVVWVSPIYDSPWEDLGYDIRNFTDVHPTFGTLDDVKELIETIHNNEMKFLMDFVPNHTSEEHEWFEESKLGRSGKEDFYVWRDPKGHENDGTPIPPNNWKSLFGGSAWEYVEEKQKFYLHQFGKFQPDLNYGSLAVLEEMKDAMRFWLDLGVDGFRMDAVPFLVEHPEMPDEPLKEGCKDAENESCIRHIYTQNQPGNYKILDEFERMFLDEYGTSKYMFLEAYAPQEETMKYYGELRSPFNFIFIQNELNSTNAVGLRDIIEGYLSNLPEGMWPNWVVGNHDTPRVGSRLGEDMIDPMNLLILALPGAVITYQGEEIGMTDTTIDPQRIVDYSGGRDPCRTPMQWDTSKNAGFSDSNTTWLPVNGNYVDVNVETESADPKSHLSIYKRLTQLRRSIADSKDINMTNFGKWILGFKRYSKFHVLYVLINLGNEEEELQVSDVFDDAKPELTVELSSQNLDYLIGNKINSHQKILLQPHSGLVLSPQ